MSGITQNTLDVIIAPVRISQCKIFINDRNYTSWTFQDIDENKEITEDNQIYDKLKDISPIEKKLFTGDVINIDGNVTYSFIKQCSNLAGVLLLDKTYGRTENKKRLLYKCIPHDKRLPFFLVPYDIKTDFQKNVINKYITFKYDNWNTQFPRAIINEMLGSVNDLSVYYEYQLYCRNLYVSLKKFTEKTKYIKQNDITGQIDVIIKNTGYVIENRRDDYIFTIDPKNSIDLDDAMSIVDMGDGTYRISIYISNVFFWMEHFDLWESFSERVSTIYLPNYKRPLLPNILSNDLCSLLEKQPRIAFVMDIFVDKTGKIMEDNTTFTHALICVSKNYEYENPKMISKDKSYKLLFSITQNLDNNASVVTDSHDLIAFWMIEFNKRCGKKMAEHKIGIFRSTVSFTNPNSDCCEEETNSELSADARRIISNWNNLSGQYIQYREEIDEMTHHILQINGYIHITSPIRRLVDLLNQMLFFSHNGVVISKSAKLFLEKWLNNLDYINTSMRSIRKIQTDCEVMQRCFENPNIMHTKYSGIVFDKVKKNDGLITYMVYLENIKMLSRITTHIDVENTTRHNFYIYLFEGEYLTKKKIRLQFILT
jgi:exoribonuclease R